MSEHKYTPAPWNQEADGNGSIVWGPNGEIIAYCEAGENSDPIENARRIVACGNACMGMPTEGLEEVILKDTFEKTSGILTERIASVEKQRDKLLAEMERYLPVLEALESVTFGWAVMTAGTGIATLNGYRNAIAKARRVKP